MESVYEKCLSFELTNSGLRNETQKALPVNYKDVQIDCGYRIDILVENKLIVELKSVDKVLPIHHIADFNLYEACRSFNRPAFEL